MAQAIARRLRTPLVRHRARSTTMTIRGVSLFVDVVGHGDPVVLMHGGPGADHWTMLPLRPLAGQNTLVSYDHRCNGRSSGAALSSMTWDNLTADADALRAALGFERWAVVGHSFGGNVALEYALRYPNSVSRLVLLDTGGDSRWAQENAPRILAGRGFSPRTVRLASRFLNGRIRPREFLPALIRLGGAYNPHTGLFAAIRQMVAERHVRMRPEALIYAGPRMLRRLDRHGPARRDPRADARAGGA